MAVATTLATPAAFVVTVSADSVALAPELGAANVTVTPGTGLPEVSFTDTCNCVPNAVEISVDCVTPPVATIDDAAPAVFARLYVSVVPAMPAAVAVTVYDPAVAFAVAVTLATPDAFVVAVSADNVAVAPPDAGTTTNVTITPETALLLPSFTVACNAVPKAVVIGVDCVAPPLTEINVGALAVFVRLYVSVVPAMPAAVAVTVYDPAVALAVAVTPATPDASVVAVSADNVAVAPPDAGTTTNVTTTPETGLLLPSFTVACNAVPKVVVIGVVWVEAPVTDTVDAAPAVFVKLNVNCVAKPATLAVT